MPPRKNQLESKLSGSASAGQPAGWKDQVGVAEQPEIAPDDSRRAGRYLRKTYLVTPELEQRIKTLAETEQVGQNELVRYMLEQMLDQIEHGVHPLPTVPVQQRTIVNS